MTTPIWSPEIAHFRSLSPEVRCFLCRKHGTPTRRQRASGSALKAQQQDIIAGIQRHQEGKVTTDPLTGPNSKGSGVSRISTPLPCPCRFGEIGAMATYRLATGEAEYNMSGMRDIASQKRALQAVWDDSHAQRGLGCFLLQIRPAPRE